ncbi:MAG: hypothetical protein V2J11_08075 [Desulfofustis sp.]|jgi:hypothetical protein|nr:hypothetical protein [Desulfofustis sp.]
MRNTVFLTATLLMLLVGSITASSATAENASGSRPGADADLAQDLTNPLADLMTIPIQVNYDREIGPRDDGRKLQTNIQPVIPFHLTEDWNLITRTILPVIHQEDIYPGAGSQFGLGDTSLSLFLSPKKLSSGGVLWGAGPILLLPTATDDLLGADKWGAGPTAVVLTLRGPWTIGALGNHIWSFAGDGDRQDISSTFLQPFAAYTWPSAWTVSVQSESTYNWKTEKWSVPVNVAVAKLVRWGKLPVSLQAGIGYWLESPDTGPEGFRFRLQANFVLPKLF